MPMLSIPQMISFDMKLILSYFLNPILRYSGYDVLVSLGLAYLFLMITIFLGIVLLIWKLRYLHS